MPKGMTRPSNIAVAGFYFFMFVLVFWPVVDWLSSIWPLQFGNLQWRYGSMGLMAAYLHTPILALFLAAFFGFLMDHRLTLRLVSVVSLLTALVLVVVLILFPLDVIQLRGGVAEEQRASFLAGAVLAELKHFTALISLLLLSVGGWKTAKSIYRPEGPQATADVLKAQQSD
jgi:hypothetical protein